MQLPRTAGERALLVGMERKGARDSWTIRDSLDELARLASTAGLHVAGRTWQKLAHPDPATWVGSGKLEEIRALAEAENALFVLLDDELTPGQQRNLEKALGNGIRVIDRTRLILDIFSQHARSREGQLQVELAQYQYLLPRLAGMRGELSQQVGGSGAGPVGLRGPGETQLELDRRRARRRIETLRRGLEEVRVQRRQHRRHRGRAGVPVVALVGYTNAGKSSLMNALTGAEVLVQDKLFATLDPTTRRLSLPGGRDVLLTDTVGFIRRLPHELVAAFRATLEGIEEASLILHVVDASHPHAAEQAAAVEKVLAGLAVSAAPVLAVWNKVDLLDGRSLPRLRGALARDSVAVSARTGQNLPALLSTMERMLAENLVELRALVPYERYDLVGLIYDQGTVLGKQDGPRGTRITALVPDALRARLAAVLEEQHHGGAEGENLHRDRKRLLGHPPRGENPKAGTGEHSG